ncbi:MAG: NAD(P)-binding protein [Chitinivibrionales bacterium]|nr:NAD(P)-binding protein [Chitinivibrionales bacterium]
MNEKKKIGIIGGGIAGLSAGCYMQMNGYKTHLFEQSPSLGGVMTPWRRKGYTFDGGTEYLTGTSPQSSLYPVMNELLDVAHLQLIDFDQFMSIQLNDGTIFKVRTDAAELEQEMLKIAAADKGIIRQFCSAIASVSDISLPVDKTPELFTLADMLKVMAGNRKLLWFFLRWKGVSIERFARRIRSDPLRRAVQYIFPRHEFFSMAGLLLPLGWMHMRNAGHPVGGSGTIISILRQKYESLGGTVSLNMAVDKLVIDKGRVCGIELRDGGELPVDAAISTADLYFNHHRLLGGKYLSPKIRKLFETKTLFPSMIQISYGINQKLPAGYHRHLVEFEEPFTCGNDRKMKFMVVRVCDYEPGFAPSGKTAVIVQLRTSDYDYWVNLRNTDMNEYRSRKMRVAEFVQQHLEMLLGFPASAVDVVDVATPATYARYTAVYRGSYQGWAPTPDMIGKALPKKVKGLDNFYMAGQWTDPPGGIFSALNSGRKITQLVCTDDRKPFVVERGR